MNLARLTLCLILGRRLPINSGEQEVPGITESITIRRDSWGIPHIEAANDPDAIFGLGYVQGQDRAFQLELLLRIVRGQLAELVGRKGLSIDRMSRRIGLRRSAKAQLTHLDNDVRAQLSAFVSGVNSGRSQGLSSPPHELSIVGGDLTPWEPEDVLGFVKFLSLLIPSNWDVELARWKILHADGADALRAIDPAGDIGDTKLSGDLSRIVDPLLRDLSAFLQWIPQGGGSNNWCVSGKRSASGAPLLASDPHLGPSIPSPWYLAHVQTPEWTIAGAQFAGSPVFPIGHNGFACWGVTAGLTDQADLFIESESTLAQAEIVREVIRVKGSDDVIEDVVITPRGPVISPLVENAQHTISLRAVWLDPLPVRGFFDAPRARNFETFRQSFAKWPFMPMNVLYADQSGTIGMQLVGQLPRRKQGSGTLPVPADDSSAGWEAEGVPFASMPYTVNPPEELLASANSNPWEPGNSFHSEHMEKPFLGVDFVDGFRARTIRDELSKRKDWSVEAFQLLQQDQKCAPWFAIRDQLLRLTTTQPQTSEVLELLRDWDGVATADSAAAAVFELWCAEMCIRVAKAQAPKSWKEALGGDGRGPFGHNLFADRRIEHLVRLVQSQPEGWFTSGWPRQFEDALDVVVHRLRAEAGPSSAYWGWGHLRILHLKHPLLGDVRWIGTAFNLQPVPIGGDSNTIFQAGWRPLDPTAPTHNFPNLRAVFDPSNWSKCRFVLAGGQSGNPCSPHYEDQFSLWQRGEGIPILLSSDEILKSSHETIRLVPQPIDGHNSIILS